MANTPTREHREAAAKSLYPLIHSSSRLWGWVEGSDSYIGHGCDCRVKTIAQALADAEQRGRETERAEVVAWLRANGFRNSSFVDDIGAGLHLAKGE